MYLAHYKKMSHKKLSSDEVPQKFIEWVLALGCPVEKIPSIEKMIEVCKGQYYLTLRSLIEHIEAKDVITHKRLNVFYDDVKQCQEKKLLNENLILSNSVLPEQLLLWKEHADIKEKVAEAEARVNEARETLNELMEKVSSKVIQRNAYRQRIADLQRRTWLLSQVSNELKTKLANLKETRTIAHSMCNVENEQHDIQNKFNKCIDLLQQKSKPSDLPLSTPVASSSILSNHENETTSNDEDDYVLSLVSCSGDVLWPHLLERLSSLYTTLADAYTKHTDVGNKRTNTQSMIVNTAALQATLGLEVIKNRVHLETTQQQLAVAIEDCSSDLPKDALELLVLRVQRAYFEARARVLKASLEELTNRSGDFECGDDRGRAAVDSQATLRDIASVNQRIIKSRDELKRLILSAANTEWKVFNVRECLVAVFTALHNDTDIRDCVLSRGVQLNFPTESMSLLRRFYRKRCERDSIGNLSLNLDISATSFGDVPDNPTFVDELNVFLNKFELEKNRRLLLDNGEKIWAFETVQALLTRLLARWVDYDVTPILHPSLKASRALQRLCDVTRLPRAAQRATEHMTQAKIPDINAIADHEAQTVDRMKKNITENRNLLNKLHEKLAVCEENLQFWSEHQLCTYISIDRTVDGKPYKEYEAIYKEKLKW